MIGRLWVNKCQVCHWRASYLLFMPNGCKVLALFIRWASRAFLTESRLLRMSSMGMRWTSLMEWPAWLKCNETGIVMLSCWWFRIELSITTPVSLHFNQADHSINDVHLIPIELIRSKRDSVRKAREAHLINKAKTLHPFGINRRYEARQWHTWHLFTHSLPVIVTYFM